jgi:hypothetical protein
MARCCHCETIIENGLLFGFWGTEEKTKPICVSCLKRFLDSDGKDTGIKQRIEKWLEGENITYNGINEPRHIFHLTLEDVGPLKMTIEVFQEKLNQNIVIGFMTFLSKDLTFRIYKFSQQEKEQFKNKVDEFLSTLRVDYRTGIRVGYEIISEGGHYGAKYFIKTKPHNFDKEKFLKILEMTKNTGQRSDEFLNQNLRS